MEPEVVGGAGASAGEDEEAAAEAGGDGLPLVDAAPRGGGWRDASRAAEHANRLEGRRVAWLGRICAVRLCGGCVLYIGPHWYCTLLMLCTVVGVGSAFIWAMAVQAQTVHAVIGALCTVGSAEALLRCALVNPGIVVRPRQKARRDEQVGRQLAHCDSCQVEMAEGVEHCDMCQVCIAGYDHHCPWMSKCVGEGNLAEFHTFLCCAFGSLAYIMITTLATT